MQTARPRPDSDLVDGRCIDRDDDDLAARLTLVPGEPQVNQRVAQRAAPARSKHATQRTQHKDMRSIVFKLFPPCTLHNPPKCPPVGCRVQPALMLQVAAAPEIPDPAIADPAAIAGRGVE